MLQKCPKQEALFEYVSIPAEMSAWRRLKMRFHARTCRTCESQMTALRAKWKSLFAPEPELTSSLMKVYSRLQNDETLILTGWKLGEPPTRRSRHGLALQQGWLFRGGVVLGLGSLLLLFATSQFRWSRESPPEPIAVAGNPNLPWAQIRTEDKNRVQVRYVRPELLQSMEFETVSTR